MAPSIRGIGPSGDTQGRRWYLPVAALLILALGFGALGTWQVRRLAWKQALIARVAAGLAAPTADAAELPAAPPEYTKLTATGEFEPQATTLVSASTRLGQGYWVMAPLRLADGRALWINRGFVPAMAATPTTSGQQTIIGLARLTETSLLRANRPVQNRWYARDIAEIAAATHVTRSETHWFIDAGLPAASAPTIADDDEAISPQPTSRGPTSPTPGLTIVRFANNHLVYALTWFLLAGLCLVGVGVVLRAARTQPARIPSKCQNPSP